MVVVSQMYFIKQLEKGRDMGFPPVSVTISLSSPPGKPAGPGYLPA